MNNAVMLWAILNGLAGFLMFWLSYRLHGKKNGAMRSEGEPEWKSMLVGGIGNSLGLLLIVIVQYVTFAVTGTVYWTDGWLYVNLLYVGADTRSAPTENN